MRACPFLTAILLATTSAAEITDIAGLGSDRENRIGWTFAPDGQSVFWAGWNGNWGDDPTSLKTIFVSERQGGGWSEPQPLPFSGEFNDDDPFVSPDGQWLYFVSDRPADASGSPGDADIWRYSLHGPRPPERLPFNSDADEYSPVATASGTVYFASARDGGFGRGDLYRAAPEGDGFTAAELLGPAVNSYTGEWNLWVSADEQDMLFEASSRPTNLSVPGDLYYSRRSAAGWTPAVAVVDLNTVGSDLLPRLHPDGETLYFATAPMGGNTQAKHVHWPSLKEQLRGSYAPPLLVANRSSHEVLQIDVGEAKVIHSYAVGEGPHLLSNVSDGRLLATGFGEFPRPHAKPVAKRPPFERRLNSRVTLIDVAGATIVWDERVEGCARPHASWIVGDQGFVTCQDESRVLQLDLQDGRTTGSYDTKQRGAHVLAFDDDSNTLVVSNTDDGSVSMIDLASGDVRVLKLGAGSEGSVALDDEVWVANGIEGSISVIDVGARRAVAKIEGVCGFPISLSEDAAGTVWIACFATSELVAIGRDDKKIQRRIELDGQPLHVLVHPERQLAYASLPRRNAIAEIDLHSGKMTREIPVGIEPDGLKWAR